MVRWRRADVALALAALVCGIGCARAPTPVRGPSWPGAPPSSGTPTYAENLAMLQFLAEEYRHDLPQRVSSPIPCVLRVVRSDDFRGYPDATAGTTYESTWIDLSRVTELGTRRTGRDDGGASHAATCASFRGEPRFALQTSIVKRVPRGELADEASPRLCIGNKASPERLAEPLRRLVKLCGGPGAR